MSPRGVAIPDIRQRLFDAAEQLLLRDGPSAVTSRMITAEAGCAKGMLHNHFDDLDAFIAALVLDRLAGAATALAALPGRAGTATVTANLRDAAHTLLTSTAPALASLAMGRPQAAQLVRQAITDGAPAFDAVEHAIAAYLDAEKPHARVDPEADTTAVALAIAGTAHHLIMLTPPDRHDRMNAVITTLARTVQPT